MASKVTTARNEIREAIAEEGCEGVPCLRDYIEAGAPYWLAKAAHAAMIEDLSAPGDIASFEKRWSGFVQRLAQTSETLFAGLPSN